MKVKSLLLFIFFLSGLLLPQQTQKLDLGGTPEESVFNVNSPIKSFIDAKKSELKNIDVIQVQKNPTGISEVIFRSRETNYMYRFDNVAGKEIKSGDNNLLKENAVTYTVTLGTFYKDAYYRGETRTVPFTYTTNGDYEIVVNNLYSLAVSSHYFPPITAPHSVTTTLVKALFNWAAYYDYKWYDDNYDDECFLPSGYPKWLCQIGANDKTAFAVIRATVANIPPPALTASISGPVNLGYNVNGTWSAYASGGYPAYHYQWYYRYPAANKTLPPLYLPPPGTWIRVGTDAPTLTRKDITSFSLKCEVTDSRGTVKTSNILNVNISQALINKATAFSIGNYPNPFNPQTEIFYELPEACKVEIKVFDMLGREVIELVNDYKDAGRYAAMFDASSLSNGMYFYRIIAANGSKILFMDTKKMLLMK